MLLKCQKFTKKNIRNNVIMTLLYSIYIVLIEFRYLDIGAEKHRSSAP